MSSEVFGRLERHVADGVLPGFVALAARGDDVHVAAVGSPGFDDPSPIGRDALFRIASLTKPIAAAAAMTMVDDGTFRLDDPVERWLPELADRRVLRSIDAELDDTVPAERPIRVEDLLSFRLGFGSVMAPADTYPIQAREAALQLATLGPPWPPTPLTPDEWLRNFATLPLMHQPGEGWLYNGGTQVLGVLLERAGGAPLEDVLRNRLLDPLGMTSTAFWARPEQIHRLTTAYAPDPVTGEMRVLDAGDDTSWWSRPPAFPSASAWLLSTIDDLWRFARMMLHGGEHEGHQVVSAESVRLMCTDHLTVEQRLGAPPFLDAHESWGLGLAVPAADDPDGPTPPGFGWNGGTGTTWRSDPASGRTGILLTQRAMTSPVPPPLFADFWACVAGV